MADCTTDEKVEDWMHAKLEIDAELKCDSLLKAESPELAGDDSMHAKLEIDGKLKCDSLAKGEYPEITGDDLMHAKAEIDGKLACDSLVKDECPELTGDDLLDAKIELEMDGKMMVDYMEAIAFLAAKEEAEAWQKVHRAMVVDTSYHRRNDFLPGELDQLC